jgi:hypothetical protein
MFSDTLFRREPDVSEVQQSRRVLVRNSAGIPENHSHWRLSLFDAQVHWEEHVATCIVPPNLFWGRVRKKHQRESKVVLGDDLARSTGGLLERML